METASYLATIKVGDAIEPTRKAISCGVSFLFREDGFVWTRLFTAKSRGEAVQRASNWFFSLKCSKHAKANIPHVTVKDLTVDDPRNEVFFYKRFRCFDANSKLLEDETIERLLKESRGKLRKSKLDRKKFACRSSVEWNRNSKRLSYRPPCLEWTGFPRLYLEPDTGAFIYKLKKQSQQTVGTKYSFRKSVNTTPMPRKEGDGRRVWTGKVIDIEKGFKIQELRYKSVRLKAKSLEAARKEISLKWSETHSADDS
ncbi:MAG: hypothetical protein CMN79_03520 [Spirochaetales bacterium]|jgi:hypothetical protein|nr:hypothetical protein [Spirochaetales bacterium]